MESGQGLEMNKEALDSRKWSFPGLGRPELAEKEARKLDTEPEKQRYVIFSFVADGFGQGFGLLRGFDGGKEPLRTERSLQSPRRPVFFFLDGRSSTARLLFGLLWSLFFPPHDQNFFEGNEGIHRAWEPCYKNLESLLGKEVVRKRRSALLPNFSQLSHA